ncbi:MAG: alpha/beta fold hydrolase [Omnitrophica WOR_2 bacterium]
MQKIISGSVKANGVDIHYCRSGGNKPAMIFAHGITDNGLCWTRVTSNFFEDYDVILYDARGHGLSGAPPSGYTFIDHAADLAGLIGALHLQKPIVIGHSMGASTALYFAGQYPDLPRAVVLEDPPPPLWWSAPPEQRKADMSWIFQYQGKTREEIAEIGRKQHPKWDESEFEAWAESKLQFSPNIANRGEYLPVPWQEYLSKITCPALLIIADQSAGAILNPEMAGEIAQYVPGMQVVQIPGAGHNIRREQYGPYVEAVKQFIEGV